MTALVFLRWWLRGRCRGPIFTPYESISGRKWHSVKHCHRLRWHRGEHQP
jgi:hypothetical protein